jgi:formylglycine-generating enzyme required for sulfatase activity
MGDARGDGDPNELPVHTVRVRAFSMGRFDVTYDEWNLCMKDGVCDEVYLAPYEESFGRGRRPVVNVTWGQARRFIGWLSKKSGKPYRLPTEAEWEYAARAGATTPYPSGNELAPGIANCYSECGEDYDLTAPVGSFKPNAFGLYDTVGNVWQWVQDCWADSYKGAPTNGSARTTGDCQSNIARGGGWRNDPHELRFSARSKMAHEIRFNMIGFRVARRD